MNRADPTREELRNAISGIVQARMHRQRRTSPTVMRGTNRWSPGNGTAAAQSGKQGGRSTAASAPASAATTDMDPPGTPATDGTAASSSSSSLSPQLEQLMPSVVRMELEAIFVRRLSERQAEIEEDLAVELKRHARWRQRGRGESEPGGGEEGVGDVSHLFRIMGATSEARGHSCECICMFGAAGDADEQGSIPPGAPALPAFWMSTGGSPQCIVVQRRQQRQQLLERDFGVADREGCASSEPTAQPRCIFVSAARVLCRGVASVQVRIHHQEWEARCVSEAEASRAQDEFVWWETVATADREELLLESGTLAILLVAATASDFVQVQRVGIAGRLE